MSHFVIVGAGECGARAAFALREKGFAGAIALIGTETIAPYERPPLSKETLAELHLPKFVATLERYAEAGIELLTGVTVSHIDTAGKSVTMSDGRRILFNKLLLATGAHARPFPGISSTGGRIRSLRTHADALALREVIVLGRHIAVIGGGFIGLELAATARKLGAQVTVVEGLPRVLKRGVPEEIAEVIAGRHRQEGVTIRCGVAIAALEEDNKEARIRLASGETITADVICVGIGALPNITLAADAGLTIDNGIAVDDRLQTSAPDVYAAGDCCSFPLTLYGGRRVRLESWRNAQEQGTLAAANMMGANEPISAVPWFWSDQYDLTLQIAGLADGATSVLRRDLGDGAFLLFHLDDAGRLLAASGIGRGNVVARDIRLAEMLIAARAHPEPMALTSSNIKLKSLLAA
ncbi:NAD(P)/FAD-dependent oxidoreductase [Rhizobium tubonense]|uniref:Ferredoxin reductase n=1 Tax=Rhizobium tubonense TaxID=484088 RepID=A0A2W4CPL7_9HYPH|nr:FAD-dependent oxidoreductase [Rhizobium tubonense]PZM14341.1 ferredoxin reductase [Rhizobium tubonense]